MAQFRTTADIVDAALRNAGEVTNGNSSYESEALGFVNRVHFSLIAGGTIALTKDQTVEIDETWPWSRAKKSLILELQPKIETGSVTVTLGSEAITFSSAPSVSVEGWYLRIIGRDGLFRIASHSASSTSAEIDGLYPEATGSLSYEVFKLDYDLTPSYIVIDSSNNKIQFQESAGTTLTATLTSGSYTPSALATEVQTQMNTTGGTPVYTVTYSALTKKFTIASDRGGSSVFILVGTGDQSLFSAHKTLGFDDENTTNAASVVSTYILGGIARLVEPFSGPRAQIYGIDRESMSREYPLVDAREGHPTRFCVISEGEDGTLKVRFDRYPEDKMRIEIDHVPVPRDLKDSSSSIPLVPRKHVDVLEDAATFRIMLLKSDDRAQIYMNLVQGTLKSMIAQHRGTLVRSGKYFGQIVSRPEGIIRRRRNLFGEEPY